MKNNQLSEALANVTPTAEPTPAPVKIEAGELNLIDSEAPKDGLQAGSGDVDKLFTLVKFTPTSGDIYARERDRRNKTTLVVGYSRKVADVQIELAGTGIYTPGTISIVQGVNEKNAHLEMSIGVWNPDTRKSSMLCADTATKERLSAWKDRTCAAFLAFCAERGIDISAPQQERAHANAVAVNLLAVAPTAQQ